MNPRDVQPPNDPRSEEAVIGALLIDPGKLAVVARTLRPGDFYTQSNGWVFEAILDAAERGAVDVVTVGDALRAAGRFDEIGGGARLAGLMQAAPSSVNVREYARTVEETARRRELLRAAGEVARSAHNQGEELGASLARAQLWVNQIQAPSTIQTFSAADVLAWPDAGKPDLIAGFLPAQSVVLFSGAGGDGKSYAMLDLAVNLARGAQWLGLATVRTPVVIVDLENGPTRFQERLRRTLYGHNLLDDPPPVSVRFGIGAALDSDQAVNELVSVMQDTGSGLLMLDSLVDFLGEVDENSNPEMGKVAERLRAIREKTGGSVLAIHHVPKSGNGPRGATALRNGVDVSCNATRDGATLRMAQDKNRSGPETTVTARMSWDNGMFALSALGMSTGRQKPPPDEDEAAIVGALEGGDWMASNDLVTAAMERTGHVRRGVQAKLKGLIDDAILEKGEAGPNRTYAVRLLRTQDGDSGV